MTALFMVAALLGASSPVPPPPPAHPVLELRQYKIVEGQRDPFVALFDRWFVESQEALGARIVGQYRDADDPHRFTWIRAFPDMVERGRILHDFYYGPVWQAHRDAANPLLDDNDNVLLLRPATPDLGLPPATGSRPAPGEHRATHGMVIVTIHYLWKKPDEGFTAFFHDRMAPALRKAGLPVLGGFVSEEAANNFPRLPVREHEKVFVWITRVPDRAAYARAMREFDAPTRATLLSETERADQVLTLAPTDRSLLR